jgi:hypothetical protein
MGDIARGIAPSVAVQDLRSQIKAIRRKTNTLIDYYIYPEPTPSALAAYDPRLAKLDNRLTLLEKIDYTEIGYLIEDSDALAAQYLMDMIVQLLNAIHGVDQLFVNHYDPRLEERKPFGTIYDLLEFREKQLEETKVAQLTDRYKLKPEDKRDNQVGQICRGAIQMINGRDRGDVAHVSERELLSDNIARLAEFQGVYLWWKCTSCDFRLRYHVNSSMHSNIHSTEEIRSHPNVKAEYKSAFLVKSHLYVPRRRDSSRGGNLRASPPLPASKYACLFCLAHGSNNSFSTGRALATHIADNHRGSKKQPAPLILLKFKVAIKGQKPEHVHRWDVNLT